MAESNTSQHRLFPMYFLMGRTIAWINTALIQHSDINQESMFLICT